MSVTTTVNVVAPRIRLVSEAMPTGEWKDPELSLGTLSDLRLGLYKCWNLREESPAKAAWEIVQNQIIRLLDENYEHLGAEGCGIGIEIFMVGRRPSKSKPTIVFSCGSKPSRQLAIELVDKKGILSNFPGIKMAGRKAFPRQMAYEDSLNQRPYAQGVYIGGPIEACGVSVLVTTLDGSSLRRATVGGFITIQDKIYGLTTAHAFQALKTEVVEPADYSDDTDYEFYDQGNEDMTDDEDDIVETTSRGSGAFKGSSDRLLTIR